jgi:transcription initiation factor TFIIB
MTTRLSTEDRCDERDDLTDDCPECHAPTTTHRGETTCTECGLVVAEDFLDRGPEWRAFDAAERHARSRVGAPTTPALFDRGVSSRIGWGGDIYGRPLSSNKRRRIARMRTQNRRAVATSKREKNLIRALAELARLVSAFDLPRTIHEEASVLYRRAYEQNLLRGRTIDGLVAGAVYASCRRLELHRNDSMGDDESICQLPTTELVGLAVDSPSDSVTEEAVYSPFKFSVPDVSAH